MKPTCQEVHDALVDSIELRWMPRLKNNYAKVPSCHLCLIFDNQVTGCRGCPLHLIGHNCLDVNSAWYKWNSSASKDKKGVQNIIDQLQKCLDTFFPKGWDK